MLRVFGKYGLRILPLSLLVTPIFLYGQDLGSSNGLFRAPNPNAKPAAASTEKRTTPKPKAVAAKPAPVKKRNVKSSTEAKNEVPEKPNSAAKTAGNSSVQPVGENIIIRVGGKKTVESADDLFDKAIEQGNEARDERNYTIAEAAYRRAQAIKPKDARSIYGLGNLFSDQQRWEEAEKAYRLAIQFEPNSPEAHIALSFVLAQPVVGGNLADRYVEAEKMARRGVELDPNNAVAYDQLGVSLELRGLINQETQNAYRKAIALDSTFALAYAHLGRLLRRNGLEEQSATAYSDAIQMAVDVPTMILVADVMQSQQRYTESEQLLRRALREDPKNPTALFLLGRALTTRGEFGEAEKLLKQSVEVSPNSFVSYALLSSLYTRRNNFDEAEKTLTKALRVVSLNERKRLSQEFEFVGDGLMRAGKKRDAARVYAQAIELDGEKALLTDKLNNAQKN